MRPSSASAEDRERGSASLEFLAGGLILLAPLVYIIVALGMVQNAAIGTESVARFVARAMAAGDEVPPHVVRDAVAEAYGLDGPGLDVMVECAPATRGCPAAGSVIVVTVSEQVALPLVPDVLGLSESLSVPVDGTATYRVERLTEGS